MNDAPDQQDIDCSRERSVIDAVDCNGQLLQRLLEQMVDLRDVVFQSPLSLPQSSSDQTAVSVDETTIAAECQQLRDRVHGLEDQVADLRQQNSDLASQVASSNVRQTVCTPNSGSDDALSWDERKKLIIQQLEEESFDAEDFIDTHCDQPRGKTESPSEFVEQLCGDLASRDEELHELRCLLEQQSETREGGVAIGAVAIAGMIDADEMVQQERQRLQSLQAEWEEKFRQGEIEASLERAKLSRERQELAKKQSEVEDLLLHARRESHQRENSGSTSSRRWLVKLGLTDTDT